MSTVFTLNPIKVNLISIKNVIKKTIVFIGIVPKDVRSELIKIENATKYNSNNKTLAKFYGKNWDVKLGLKKTQLKTGGNVNEPDPSDVIWGGDEFSFDDDTEIKTPNEADDNEADDNEADDNEADDNEADDNEADDNEADDNEADNKKEIIKKKQKLVGSNLEQIKDNIYPNEIKSDVVDESIVHDIISLDELVSLETEPIMVDSDFKKVSQITMVEGNNLKIKFIFADPFVSLYPEDNVLEFKKKLYMVLNIPIYRQHLWYVYQGRIYPLNYSIFHNESLLYINTQDMLDKYNDKNSGQQLIENIPVNSKYYKMKSFIKITCMDTFTILDEYYHKYGITEYNLLDLNDFIAPTNKSLNKSINDRYQLELIYYSFVMLYWPMLSLTAFIDYMNGESNMKKFYPDLHPPVEEITQIYKLEKKITDEMLDLITNPKKKDLLKKIRGKITNSITDSIISVLKYQNSKDTILFIRNLFDIFPLTSNIIGCKCYMNHNGRKIILNKSWDIDKNINDVIPLDSILFKIRIDKETTKTINLILYKNGNYVIKAIWNEESQYDFDDIFNITRELTKTVIDQINSFGSYVLANQKILPIMNKNNSKFTEIRMSMFYKQSITYDQFTLLKNIMNDYRKAGIVRERFVEKSHAEYYFSKGMHQFKPERIERVVTVNNFYDFLTDGTVKQKWHTLFEKTRITKLSHRFSDVKIEIIGIKENEFFIFYNYILNLFHLYDIRCKDLSTNHSSQIQITTDRKLKKTLSNLKEQDPILYNFKKLYKTENIYSKICQKSYQPLLLTKQSYDELPKDSKKNAVKYWNFTTNKDAYYVCPNPKFPYIKFIIKRHPKDYCIPCCKKTQISSNAKDPKRIIYDICIKNRAYTKEERTITQGSRYIMSYGKDIEPGRLSRLPENSMEPLFYETYSIKNQGIDQECITSDGYYLYGVDQIANGIQKMGMLNSIIHAMEIPLVEFINQVIKHLKDSPNKFRVILNGHINKYYRKSEDMITDLYDMFLKPDKTVATQNEIPWNSIFIDIVYLFMNVNVVHFTHKRRERIKLHLPNHATNKDNFFLENYKNIIVLQKRNIFYPTYLLNTDVFFKVKMFSKKLFEFSDNIMIIIGRVITGYFNEKIKKNITSDKIDLNILNKFVKDTSYNIHRIFVNNSNMCYYVHLKSKSTDIYMPVESSHYISKGNIETTYTPFMRCINKMTFKTFNGFLMDFNHWIAKKSEEVGMLRLDVDKSSPLEKRVQPIYPYIKINNWIVLKNGTVKPTDPVIGFVSHDIHYYFSAITVKQAMQIRKKNLIQLLYDPDIINRQIYSNADIIADNRSKNIGKSIYDSNLYQLLLLEFMTIFNKQKNNTLRTKLKKILLGNFNKDFDDLMDAVENIILDCDDYCKIKTQIGEFINNHHSKNLLFHEIDDSFYKFDRETFESIKSLPYDKLIQSLHKLSHKFITVGSVSGLKDFQFPNMFISCQTQNSHRIPYCKKHKFIIEKKKLNELLEIMAADILNPVKEKWLFNSVFTDNVITFFKFRQRPNEFITVAIEE
jgi:hypothetical protein